MSELLFGRLIGLIFTLRSGLSREWRVKDDHLVENQEDMRNQELRSRRKGYKLTSPNLRLGGRRANVSTQVLGSHLVSIDAP